MFDYRFQGRLTYIGGGLNVQMSAWPAAGANWWEPTTGSFTVVAAYKAIGAADLAASYVNLVNPGTYNAAPGNAPDFDAAYGWQFNGTNDYLMTGYAPGDTRATTVIVRAYSTSALYGDRTIAGCANGDGTGRLRLQDASHPNRSFYHGGGKGTTGSATVLNDWAIGAIAGSNGYYDGNLFVSGIPAGTGNVPNIAIGAERYGAGVALPFKGYIAAVAIYSTTLDVTQIGEVTAAMAAL